jgi:hypothetical protein
MKSSSLPVALITAVLLSACSPNEDAPAPAPPPATAGVTNQPAAASAPNPAFEKLKGRWLRPDGGYIVEIRAVAPGGQMDATYSNPRPSHVAQAQATQDGTVTKVFIELRDVNYPGSTYTLAYDAENDQLKGIYFQAVERQNFEVLFVRLK